MLQDSDVELDGEFNKCVFIFLHSMTMHLFIFCCIWFSFGLETTDIFIGGLLYFIVMFQNHFRAPHFYLRHCDSFVVNVRYICRYCPPIKNNHNIIFSRGIYIWFMIVVNLRNVYAVVMSDLMIPWEKINSMLFTKINWILHFFYFTDNEEKRERKAPSSSKIRTTTWHKHDTGVGVSQAQWRISVYLCWESECKLRHKTHDLMPYWGP